MSFLFSSLATHICERMALVITADENPSPWETFFHEGVTPHVGKLQHNSEVFWTENDLTRYIAKSNIEI